MNGSEINDGPPHALAIITPRAAIGDNPLSVSVEDMPAILDKFTEWRNVFRKWLFEQMGEGTHYGVAPGCAPKFGRDGCPVDRKGNRVDPKSWTYKPALYAAGADLIADCMQFDREFATDEVTWRQLGEPKGTVVRKCTLRRRPGSPFMAQVEDGGIVGQGTGADDVGDYNPANKAIKMADKRALVAAVINVMAIRDLFTQDGGPMDTPDKDKEAPTAPTREERKADRPTNAARLNVFKGLYNQKINPAGKLVEFLDWCAVIVGTDIVNLQQPNLWTEEQMIAVEARLK